MHREPNLPLVFTREQAIRYGVSPNAITWRAAHGQWERLRRGAFCLAETFDACASEARHLLTALVSLAIEGRVEALSHLTAAVAYGWPAPLDLAEDPWFTIDPREHKPTRRRSGVVRQVASLPPGHLWSYDEFALTSPARTVADCLRHFAPRVSLPIADAAAAEGVDPVSVGRVLDWQAGWPYAERGRRTAQLIDGRHESWLESQSAIAHHELGIPESLPQAAILDPRGREVARVNFLWSNFGVIGEADGWDKYESEPGSGRRSPSGLVSLAVLRREKEREDRLRDLGYQVVRWGTADALSPHRRLQPMLARAFARGEPSAVRGSFRATTPRLARSPAPVRLDELRRLSSSGVLLAVPRRYSSSVG